MKRNKIAYLIFLIFFIADLSYSFYQHYHLPLYGDISEVVCPSGPKHGYYDVLHDPLGLSVITGNKTYSNPNRFFAHWESSQYFMNMPLLLQKLTSPVNSIYLSVAIVKTLIQLLLIFLLAFFISRKKIFSFDFLLAAVLVIPFFQTCGYNRFMGIIDHSVIYTIFYALSLALTMIFFLPFYRNYDLRKPFGWPLRIFLFFFVFVITLNGPLAPGVILIVCPVVLLRLFYEEYSKTDVTDLRSKIRKSIKNIPQDYLFFFVFACLMSLYSLFIGSRNSLNYPNSLMDRYLGLPQGLFNIFTGRPALPILVSAILVNIILIKVKRFERGRNVLRFMTWIFIFSMIYILLLPLGGYRSYRPFSVRYDTILPVTLALVFAFGYTSFFLLRNLKKKYIFATYLTGILVLFTLADEYDPAYFKREKEIITELSGHSEKMIIISCDCPVMNWEVITNPGYLLLNSDLFIHWNIMKPGQVYRQDCSDEEVKQAGKAPKPGQDEKISR